MDADQKALIEVSNRYQLCSEVYTHALEGFLEGRVKEDVFSRAWDEKENAFEDLFKIKQRLIKEMCSYLTLITSLIHEAALSFPSFRSSNSRAYLDGSQSISINSPTLNWYVCMLLFQLFKK
ncbi:hypothetical protein [Vibrio penaeicida]|uniref:hypothetical protein n=1 Tax=Vibrio penaeicida TaxID=104609 RepID=UPI001CC603D4|nr:hypothetical protein [Vibrio penaeicida]